MEDFDDFLVIDVDITYNALLGDPTDAQECEDPVYISPVLEVPAVERPRDNSRKQ